ncbi:MAG: hypothetical protein KKD77_21630 [Gammaproteobacteria bacterium]|nr:hypothetical protein [Gammaproteobacteria bacterium]
MLGRKKTNGMTDLWGVEMPVARAQEIKAFVNDPKWEGLIEPWLKQRVELLRNRYDDCDPESLLEIQAAVRETRKLANLREDARGWSVD